VDIFVVALAVAETVSIFKSFGSDQFEISRGANVI